MTKNHASISTKPISSGGGRVDLLEPRYTAAEREQLEELQSRINVARQVLHYRLALGLSQDELGRLAGTKQSRISELELMDGNLRFDTLDRIARVLGLAVTLVRRDQVPALPATRGKQFMYRINATAKLPSTSPYKWEGNNPFMATAHG